MTECVENVQVRHGELDFLGGVETGRDMREEGLTDVGENASGTDRHEKFDLS